MPNSCDDVIFLFTGISAIFRGPVSSWEEARTFLKNNKKLDFLNTEDEISRNMDRHNFKKVLKYYNCLKDQNYSNKSEDLPVLHDYFLELVCYVGSSLRKDEIITEITIMNKEIENLHKGLQLNK